MKNRAVYWCWVLTGCLVGTFFGFHVEAGDARPTHCRQGYVHHGHRCIKKPVLRHSERTVRRSRRRTTDSIVPSLSPEQVRGTEWAIYRAKNAVLPATTEPPLPPPDPIPTKPNRLPQPWTFTPSTVTCQTEGQPEGQCLLTVPEPSVSVSAGGPVPDGVEVEVTKLALNPVEWVRETQIELQAPTGHLRVHHSEAFQAHERIGAWNSHPFGVVPTAWWTEREGEPACIQAVNPVTHEKEYVNLPCVLDCTPEGVTTPEPCHQGLITPFYYERDPGEEASLTEDNPIYVAQSGRGQVILE